MMLRIEELLLEPEGAAAIPDDYTFRDFWRGSHFSRDSECYQQYVAEDEAGRQVARFELDHGAKRRNFISSSYAIPPKGSPLLEIQFLDVREQYRGLGIGTLVVRYLEQAYPDHQLIALAKDGSEGFWAKMDWSLVAPSDSSRRDLFVAPSRT